MLLALLSALAASGDTDQRPLPPIPLVDFAGTEARSLDDFLGQPVLLDFFAHWCAPCARLVPHVNELAAEHGPHGLVVLGVTADDAATASAWLAQHGAEYPFARDEGLALQIELGFHALPFAALVDPTGVIVWTGNPRDLPDDVLARALDGALPAPAHRWPPEAAPLRAALREDAFERAAALAAAVPGSGGELAAFVERLVARRAEQMEAALRAGDYLGADELASSLERSLSEGERRARAAAVRASIAADDEQRARLEAQRELRELWRTVKDVDTVQAADALAAEIRLLAADHPDTAVARRADEHLAALEMLKQLF